MIDRTYQSYGAKSGVGLGGWRCPGIILSNEQKPSCWGTKGPADSDYTYYTDSDQTYYTHCPVKAKKR